MDQYSDSVEKRDTVCYFFAFQEMEEVPNEKKNPVRERRVMGQLTQ